MRWLGSGVRAGCRWTDPLLLQSVCQSIIVQGAEHPQVGPEASITVCVCVCATKCLVTDKSAACMCVTG